MVTTKDKIIVENLLKNSLIDFAITHNNKEMFKRLSSENWREYIVRDTRLPIQPKFNNVDWGVWSQSITTAKKLVKDGYTTCLDYETVLEIYNDVLEFFDLVRKGEALDINFLGGDLLD